MKKVGVIAAAVVILALGGCRDLGLDGNVPEEQSRTQAPPDLVRDVIPPPAETITRLVVDGRLWIPTGRPAHYSSGRLRPVGSAAGQTVYARAWDERPYVALFTRATIRASEDAATAREAMDAGTEQWQEYAPVRGQSGSASDSDRLRHDLIREAPPGPD